MWKALIKMIPAKVIMQYLPKILSYLLTKGLTWLFANYPEKAPLYLDKSIELADAMKKTGEAAADGKITAKEVEKLQTEWEEVFK